MALDLERCPPPPPFNTSNTMKLEEDENSLRLHLSLARLIEMQVDRSMGKKKLNKIVVKAKVADDDDDHHADAEDNEIEVIEKADSPSSLAGDLNQMCVDDDGKNGSPPDRSSKNKAAKLPAKKRGREKTAASMQKQGLKVPSKGSRKQFEPSGIAEQYGSLTRKRKSPSEMVVQYYGEQSESDTQHPGKESDKDSETLPMDLSEATVHPAKRFHKDPEKSKHLDSDYVSERPIISFDQSEESAAVAAARSSLLDTGSMSDSTSSATMASPSSKRMKCMKARWYKKWQDTLDAEATGHKSSALSSSEDVEMTKEDSAISSVEVSRDEVAMARASKKLIPDDDNQSDSGSVESVESDSSVASASSVPEELVGKINVMDYQMIKQLTSITSQKYLARNSKVRRTLHTNRRNYFKYSDLVELIIEKRYNIRGSKGKKVAALKKAKIKKIGSDSSSQGSLSGDDGQTKLALPTTDKTIQPYVCANVITGSKDTPEEYVEMPWPLSSEIPNRKPKELDSQTKQSLCSFVPGKFVRVGNTMTAVSQREAFQPMEPSMLPEVSSSVPRLPSPNTQAKNPGLRSAFYNL